MLIGNTEKLAFGVRPVVPGWDTRYAPERGAWAGLAIWVRGQNLCRHLLPGSDQVQEELFVPLGPIADWLVRSHAALLWEERAPLFPTTRRLHESLRSWGVRPPMAGVDADTWFEARERWWMRHFLAAGGDGAQLPDVALLRDDEELVVDWIPARFAGSPAPRFLDSQGNASVPWKDGIEALRAFVSTVADALRQAGLVDLYDWSRANDPIPGSPSDFKSALELFTGRSHDELLGLTGASSLTEMIDLLGLSGSTDPAASPSSQALRDLPPSLSVEFRFVLQQLESATKQRHDLGLLRNARDVAKDAMDVATTPEEAGQRAARVTRALLGLDGGPVGAERDLLARLGVSLVDVPLQTFRERMVAGARDGGGAVALILDTPRTRTRWGHRFEVGRALGHLIADPMRGDAVGAAGSPYTTDKRRRRSGAFAAELLLPEEALERETGDVLDAGAEPEVFERIMRTYGVGARTAAHQLFNMGLLSTAAVRDDLIDTYAHEDLAR